MHKHRILTTHHASAKSRTTAKIVLATVCGLSFMVVPVVQNTHHAVADTATSQLAPAERPPLPPATGAYFAVENTKPTVGTPACTEEETCIIELSGRDGQPVGKGVTVWLHFDSDDSDDDDVESYIKLTTDEHGLVAIPSFTPTTVGEVTLVAYGPRDRNSEDPKNSIYLGQQLFDVQPGPPAKAELPEISGAEGKQIDNPGSVTIRDAYDNPVPNTKVFIKVPGKSEAVEVTTDSNGAAQIPAFTPTSEDKTVTVYKANGKQKGDMLSSKEVTLAPPSAAPTKVTANKTGVSGKTTANTSVTATVPKGDNMSCTLTGTSNDRGEFTVNWTESCPLPADGTEVSVTATQTGKSPSKAVKATVDGTLHDPTASDPTYNNNGDQEFIVTIDSDVTADPTVCFTPKDATECKPVDKDNVVRTRDGKWKVTVPGSENPEGGMLKIDIVDNAGNQATATIEAPSARPSAPTELIASASHVRGHVPDMNADGNPSTVIVKNAKGEVIAEGKTNGKGDFSLTYKEGKTPADGEQLTVTYMRGKVESKPATVTVDATAPTAHITLNPNTPDKVTGTTDADARKVEVIVKPAAGGEESNVQGTINKDGSFTVNTPVLHTGDTIVVTITDDKGNSSSTSKVVDFTTPDAPTDITVNAEDATIHGKAEPGSTVQVTLPDGTVLTAKTGENGEFTVQIPEDHQLKDGESINIIAVDDSNNASESASYVYHAPAKEDENTGDADDADDMDDAADTDDSDNSTKDESTDTSEDGMTAPEKAEEPSKKDETPAIPEPKPTKLAATGSSVSTIALLAISMLTAAGAVFTTKRSRVNK